VRIAGSKSGCAGSAIGASASARRRAHLYIADAPSARRLGDTSERSAALDCMQLGCSDTAIESALTKASLRRRK
jgi:hypothetical protein